MNEPDKEEFSEEGAEERFNRTLGVLANTPPVPRKSSEPKESGKERAK